MAGLSTALSSALSGLMVTSSQSAVASKNVTRASDDGYTRKILGLTTDLFGNVRAGNVTRTAEKKLIDSVNASSSDQAGKTAIYDALERLAETIGDVEADGSVAWGITQLQATLAEYAANPSSLPMASQTIAAASTLAQSLNMAAETVATVRQEADTAIAASVSNINTILGKIQELNTQITSGKQSEVSVPDLMDERDALIKQLSSEMGVRTLAKPNNGIAIYTDSGATLFDVSARAVTFAANGAIAPGVTGNAVYVDGVQVTGAGSPMPLQRGSIVANVTIRDQLAMTYEAQLDEVARGLVQLFAETDQSDPPTLDAATGLFSYNGSPTVPPTGTRYPGMAAQLRVNVLFDASKGGNPMLLRDGGANGAAYVYNSEGETGFQARLDSLTSLLSQNQSFDPSSGLSGSAPILSFSTQSAGWLEQRRSAAARDLDSSQATLQRASEALSRKSGVNIDEEMATLLSLEKSYQASAKVMTTVDNMLSILMDIVR
ncbi:MAG: flagellar hook-associated protein FlgK [Proteobacteria bacterium]|nr:flagellar hook-associated protein FlgK [Pseudomonadota bacterium]